MNYLLFLSLISLTCVTSHVREEDINLCKENMESFAENVDYKLDEKVCRIIEVDSIFHSKSAHFNCSA